MTFYNPVFEGISPRYTYGDCPLVFSFCPLILFSGSNKFLFIVHTLVHGLGDSYIGLGYSPW